MRRIAIFSPNQSSVYLNAMLGLKKQFENRGIAVHIAAGYYRADILAQFCDLWKPDVVLEIDRTRDNADGMPDDIRHLAWIQDWRSMGTNGAGNSTDRFGGSDHYYFCVRPSSVGVDVDGLRWSYLLYGTDPDVYFPEGVDGGSDFSMMGYIPPQSVFNQLETPLPVALVQGPASSGMFGTVADAVAALRAAGLSWNCYDPTAARRVLNAHVRSVYRSSTSALLPARFAEAMADDTRSLVPEPTMLTIENGILRAEARSDVVRAALRASSSLRLFGYPDWLTYPEFAPYYKGTVTRESDVRGIHNSSKIILHNAMTQMHSRALDAMASGAVVMVNKMLHNTADEPDCMRCWFDEGRAYFEYGDDLADRAREIMDDYDLRVRIGLEARERILAAHTWSHRVEQIIADAEAM